MAKRRTKMEKDLVRLRRENEFLRAQFKSKIGKEFTQEEAVEDINVPKPQKEHGIIGYTSPEYLKEDLKKTFLVSALVLITLALLYHTEDRWSTFFHF